MSERYFVRFEDVETGNLTLLEAFPVSAMASEKNFLVFDMPEDQNEIKILGRRRKIDE